MKQPLFSKPSVPADFAFQQTEGSKPRGTDFFEWYLTRLTQRAHIDGKLADAFFPVARMEKPHLAAASKRTMTSIQADRLNLE